MIRNTKKSGILTMVLVSGALAATLSAQNQVVDVISLGAQNNGSNPAATTTAFQKAFQMAAPFGKVIVPPGDYAINNSSGPLTVTNFQGEFKFEGHARLLFSSNATGGVLFNQGWGIRIIGFHSSSATQPGSVAPNAPALAVTGTTNIFINEAIVENSPGPGVFLNNNVTPKLSNISVLSSLGQGIVIQNSHGAEIVNATVSGSGQDGIVFTTTSGVSGQDGAHGSNLIVSSSSGKGIAVFGESFVTISSFTIESSISSGIYCGTSPGSAVPSQVLFQGGFISNTAGFGIEYNQGQSCSFSNIQVSGSGNRGVSGSANGGTVDLRNIRVTGNLQGDAFNLTNTGTVRISDSAAENSPGHGFYFGGNTATIATALSTHNVSKQSSLHRAIWFANGTSVVAVDLTLVDDQSAATGNVIGTSSMTTGAIHSIAASIASGSLTVQNGSPGVKVTSIN